MSLRGSGAKAPRPKQSPFRQVTFLDSRIPFSGRLLRREEHPPRNDMLTESLRQSSAEMILPSEIREELDASLPPVLVRALEGEL
jgi:hypothetical protein